MYKENFLVVFAPLAAILIILVCVHLTTSPNKLSTSSKTTAFYSDESCSSCPSFVESADCANSESPVLGGLDFVQYFTDFKNDDGTYDETQVGTIGSSSYTSTYNGYTFYFKSSDNKDLFDASPSSYVPQFGGFCGWGVSGETCPEYPWAADCLGPSGNWNHWTIQEDKLYFFLFSDAKAKFMADTTTYIASGTSRWESWFGDSSDSYFSTTCYVSTDSDGNVNHGNSIPTPNHRAFNDIRPNNKVEPAKPADE
jgi:YHS domain-containing protein